MPVDRDKLLKALIKQRDGYKLLAEIYRIESLVHRCPGKALHLIEAGRKLEKEARDGA